MDGAKPGRVQISQRAALLMLGVWTIAFVGVVLWGLRLDARFRAEHPVPTAPVTNPADYWPPSLPPRDTVVELDTDFGRFRLPIGYLTSPPIPSQSALPPSGSARYRYAVPWFEFHFTMPDGRQNRARAYFWGNDDGGDRIGVDPARYAVWVTRITKPQMSSTEVQVLRSEALPGELQQTNPGREVAYNEAWFRGWAEAARTGEAVGLTLGCSLSSHLCQGEAYLSRQGLVAQILIEDDRRASVFDVVGKISEMLQDWRI